MLGLKGANGENKRSLINDLTVEVLETWLGLTA